MHILSTLHTAASRGSKDPNEIFGRVMRASKNGPVTPGPPGTAPPLPPGTAAEVRRAGMRGHRAYGVDGRPVVDGICMEGARYAPLCVWKGSVPSLPGRLLYHRCPLFLPRAFQAVATRGGAPTMGERRTPPQWRTRLCPPSTSRQVV